MAEGIHQLLHRVEVALSGVRLAEKEYAAQLAPRFLIFDYLRADELGLSHCLADLLNPAGSHAQGRIFLDAFSNLVSKESHFAGPVRYVELEHQIDSGRRIDILLEFANGARLAIENKPWASDQANQLADYAANLGRRAESGQGSPWLLVYLCNSLPDTSSIDPGKRSILEQSGNFIILSFAELCEALEACVGKIKAMAVQVFVQELIKFIRRDVNGESSVNEQEQIAQAVLENETHLRNALSIAANIGVVKNKLMMQFKDDLLSRMADAKFAKLQLQTTSDAGYRCCWDMPSDGRYLGWNIVLDTGATFGDVILRFEFDRSGYNFLFWGIPSFAPKRGGADAIKAAQVHVRLKEKNLADGGSEPWWSVWGHARTGLNLPRDWGLEHDIWAALMHGTANQGNPVDHILEFALRTQSILAAV